jgi:hypothetical protein
MPTVVDVEWRKNRAGFIDLRARDPAQQLAHLLWVCGLIQLQQQFSRNERDIAQFVVSRVVETNSLAVPKPRKNVSRLFHAVESEIGHASEQSALTRDPVITSDSS